MYACSASPGTNTRAHGAAEAHRGDGRTDNCARASDSYSSYPAEAGRANGHRAARRSGSGAAEIRWHAASRHGG